MVLKGCCALDLDGTLTDEPLTMPEPVRQRLEQLHHQGWALLFLTGRTFSLGRQPLRALQVPYAFAVQQGSLLLHMPDEQILGRWELPTSLLHELEKLALETGLGMVVYGGWEQHDTAFYRKQSLAEAHLAHVAHLESFGTEPWRRIDSWSQLQQPTIPLVKLFGDPKACARAAQALATSNQWHVSLIKDPFHPTFSLLLITHPQAHKGHALEALVDRGALGALPIIAAGNDRNDLPLLERATVAIAMEGSPPELLAAADIVAPPCRQLGILPALEEACRRLDHGEESAS